MYPYYNYYKSPVGFVNTNTQISYTPKPPEPVFNKLKRIFFPIPPRVLEPKYTQLTFSELAWVKINCFTHLAGTYEITGYGKIEGETITDIKIAQQTVQGAHALITPEANIVLAMSIPLEEIHLWNFDWHSHVDMGVFRSGTDTTNYNERYTNMNSTSFPCLVFNKRQEMKCAEWFGENAFTEIEMITPQITMTEQEVEAIFKVCEEEVNQMVSKSTYTAPCQKKEGTKAEEKQERKSDIDYINWTAQDFKNCYWDYAECCFVKGTGSVPLSKKVQKRLDKLKIKVAYAKIKQVENSLANKYGEGEKEFTHCQECGDEINFPQEREVGYCTACGDKLFGEGAIPTEEVDPYPEIPKCTNCQTLLDHEDEDELETGLCTTCMLEATEPDPSFK